MTTDKLAGSPPPSATDARPRSRLPPTGGLRSDRQALRASSERDPAVDVVADIPAETPAIDQAARLLPNIVVWEPPEACSTFSDALRALINACPGVSVVVLLPRPTAPVVRQCLDAGARAVLGKSCGASDLADAVRAVREGRTYLCHGAANLLASQTDSSPTDNPTAGQSLTPREIEILRLVAQGQSTKEIAKNLSISVRTVDAHRRNLMTKLGRRSVAGLTQHAIRQGLVSIE